MYLFLILAMPVSFYIYLLLNKKDSIFKQAIFFLIGLILSSIHVVFDFFLNSSYSLSVFKLSSNYFSFLVIPELIPILICGIVIFLFSKDKIDFKLDSFSSILFGYFSLFLPFYTITRNSEFDFFLLFALPLIFIAMFFYIDCAFSLIQKVLINEYKKIAILFIVLCLLIAILLPPFFYALYYIDCLLGLLIGLLVLYFALPVLMWLFAKKFLKN